MKKISLGIVCGVFSALGSVNAYAEEVYNPGPFNPPKNINFSESEPDKARQETAEKLRRYQQKMPQAETALQSAIEQCKQTYDTRKTQTHVPLASCYNQAIMTIYQHVDYPYMDLIQSVNEKRLEVWRRVDNKVMTEAEGAAELNRFSAGEIQEERRRNSDLMNN